MTCWYTLSMSVPSRSKRNEGVGDSLYATAEAMAHSLPAPGTSGAGGAAGWWWRGDERDEDVVDDLAQDVAGDGLERHHHFVAEQVEGEIDDPGGEPVRVDLPALGGPVDDLPDGGAAGCEKRVAQLGRGGASLVVVAAEHAADQGGHGVAGGVGLGEQRKKVAAEGAGVGNGRRIGGAAVADGGAQHVLAGLPAAVEHRFAGPGARGDRIDGEMLVALSDQLLPRGIEDRALQLGAAAAGLPVAALLVVIGRGPAHGRILAALSTRGETICRWDRPHVSRLLLLGRGGRGRGSARRP